MIELSNDSEWTDEIVVVVLGFYVPPLGHTETGFFLCFGLFPNGI